MTDIALKCNCGAVRGRVHDYSPRGSVRAICYCIDCQTYAHYLGKPEEILDQHGGSDVTPVTPWQIEVTQGKENLKCVRLSPKGLFRWYADCCKTPVANLPANPKVPYAGLMHPFIDEDYKLGPVQGRVYGKYGIGKLPEGTPEKVTPGFMLKSLGLLAQALVKKKVVAEPFPAVGAYVLSKEEREKLRALCGPKA